MLSAGLRYFKDRIDADSIWRYELGMKSVLDEGRVLLEAAVFYNEWDNVAVRVPITPQINGLANSDGTRTYGLELNLLWQPIRALNLQVGGSWMDAVYAADVPGTPLLWATRMARSMPAGRPSLMQMMFSCATAPPIACNRAPLACVFVTTIEWAEDSY